MLLSRDQKVKGLQLETSKRYMSLHVDMSAHFKVFEKFYLCSTNVDE